jgi:abortive infection bacteriophage resistance protein
MKIAYSKQALSAPEQVKLLKSRGLIIKDEQFAINILTHINYYRLSAYIYPFLENKENHTFKENVSFENILAIYNFDRELRLLFMDAIERIEVSIRTNVIYVLSIKHNPFWLSSKDYFYNESKYDSLIQKLKEEFTRSDEKFLKHYFSKYSEEIPPTWISLEVASFGLTSLFYQNLKSNKDRKEIAGRFGLSHITFTSWLHSLTYIRNICAHHSRLWNRELGIQPGIPHSTGSLWLKSSTNYKNDRTFYVIAILIYFLRIVNHSDTFINKLNDLFNNYPMIDLAAMGFPKNWKDEDLFK